MPWRSSNGSPEPVRSYATETRRGPTAVGAVKETVVVMLLLPGVGRHLVNNNYRRVACSSRGGAVPDAEARLQRGRAPGCRRCRGGVALFPLPRGRPRLDSA